MKRFAISCTLVFGLLAAVALAQSQDVPGTTRVWQEQQIPTNVTPSDAGAGLQMHEIDSYRLGVCAPNIEDTWGGPILTGGTLAGQFYDHLTDGGWQSLAGNNATIANGVTRCQWFDRENMNDFGRLRFNATAVTYTFADGGYANDGGRQIQVIMKGRYK